MKEICIPEIIRYISIYFIPLERYGSISLLSHNTLNEVRFSDLVVLHGASGPGNPCYGVQARLVNFTLSSFTLHFKLLCESKATLPMLQMQ